MITSKQRQRQLARARYERQQAQRESRAKRQRLIRLVVGALVGLVVLAALGWLVLHIVNEEKKREPNVPTPSIPFSTDLQTPSSNVSPTSGEPTKDSE